MEQRPSPLLRDMPERLGRYRLVRPLSKGGMAHVFEGRRESLAGVSPRVAVKLILPEYAKKEGFQELFINEARLGASMHHQNLVQIQDFDRDGDHFYLVMEYVEGLTLRRIIGLCARHGHPIPLGVIAEIGRQACDGLFYAHVAKDDAGRPLGLVHRDVKPSNLILNPQGVVKVLDFGISKGPLLAERKGAVKGTWGYMAPEQAHGAEVGPAADQFGLAIVLWELAVREAMFPQTAKNDQVLKMLDDNFGARAVERIDPSYGALRNVLLRALSHAPGGRYPTAAEMGRELAALSPDPMTARDEAVRFFQRLDALDRGKPMPAQTGRPATGANTGSQASLVQTGSAAATSPGQPLGVVLLTSFGLGMVAVGAVALVLMAAFGLQWMQVEPPSVAEALPEAPPALAADEPAGPAAEGAPGELRPPPAALRGQAEPVSRPPPSASVPTPSGGSGAVVAARVGAAPAPAPEEVRVVVDRTRPPEAAAAQTVVVHAPEPAVEAPAAVGVGRVWISAVQPGFEVWIDGAMVKKGAVAAHKLPAGTHRITLFSAEGARKDFELVVEPDGEHRKYYDFVRLEFRK